MVLDNVDGPESDGFVESLPGSDSDPHTSSESTRLRYHIDPEGLPRPMKILGGLSGYDSLLDMRLKLRIRNAASLLGRPPRQEEVDALAFWTAKQLSIMSYGPVTGYSWGLWRAYATRKTFGFPFHTPKFKHNGLAWPSSSFRLLSGSMAQAAWHCSRAGAYALLGHFVTSIFLTSYSFSVMAVGERSDQRLKEVVEARDREVKAMRDHTASSQSQPVEPSRTQSTPSTPYNSVPQAQQTENTLDTGKQTWTFDVGSDDVPPFLGGGEKRQEGVRAAAGGSAWERLRQQGANEAGTTATRGSSWSSVRASWGTDPGQRTRAATPDSSRQDYRGPRNQGKADSKDSFAYSTEEEDRQLAREEAQRDFDAAVEQERAGGIESGYHKRW